MFLEPLIVSCMALHAQQSEVQTLQFNKAISRFGKASKWHCSLQLFTDMKLAHCLPDVITYSSMMDACGKGQKWQQALSLLSQMDLVVVRPNTYTYSCAIAACAKASAWIMAETLLKDSFKEFSSCFSLGSAISACHGTHGGWERAQVLLEFGIVSSIQVDTPCFNGALSAYRRQWLQALARLCSMREGLAVPNVVSFSSAISSLREGNCLGSAWPKSLILLEKMSKAVVFCHWFSTIVNPFHISPSWVSRSIYCLFLVKKVVKSRRKHRKLKYLL